MPAPSNKKKNSKPKQTSNPPAISQTTRLSSSTTPPNEPKRVLDFAFFIENADGNNIREFLDIAATTYEGQNLKLLFLRAYRVGKDAGYHEGYLEGEEDGHNSGYNEGYVEGRKCDDKAAIEEFHQLIRQSFSCGS